jgi:NAD(P)-dependent dehydrogenase (short-subunit alcohol dehydrogenase family)
VVTGGLGLLGSAFSRSLAEYGAHVVVVDLDSAAAGAAAEEHEQATGRRCLGLGCDVADEKAVSMMVDETVATFGSVDILFNNAASKSPNLQAFFAPPEDYDLRTWRETMAVNLDGLFLVARSVGKRMIEQGAGGSIVQTSSIYGMLGADRRIYEGSHYLGHQISTPPVYATSKAGVIGLTRYLATDWARHGIRVNALVPGGVQSGQNDVFVEKYSARVPLGRMAQVRDMVGPALFLASDASNYMTGQCVVVDGGLSAW